ncbi:Z-ring formation inhibitor MciZ [Bacillus sp. 2205SS5-2]
MHRNGILFSGKAWEIRAALEKYRNTYHYVKEWVDDIHPK